MESLFCGYFEGPNTLQHQAELVVLVLHGVGSEAQPGQGADVLDGLRTNGAPKGVQPGGAIC